MASLFPFPKFVGLDNNGKPLSGGKLYTYVAGTSTPLATYTTQTGSSTNSNPVVLDASGRADVWLGSSAYKMILKDSSNTTIWTVDNITSGGNSLGVYNVKDYGAKGDGATDDYAAINSAIQAAQTAGGGIVYFPPSSSPYCISQTLIINTSFVRLKGIGGLIDGSQPLVDTWVNLALKSRTVIKWIGAADYQMVLISPVDDGAHNALVGNGIDGIVLDGNSLAGDGLQLFTGRGGIYNDVSIIRYKRYGMNIGVVTHTVYGGNVSCSYNTFSNICCSTNGLAGNTGIGLVLWGNIPSGNACFNRFYACQWLGALPGAYDRQVSIECTDDNSFFGCCWNSALFLESSDTCTLSTPTVGANSYERFSMLNRFYGCQGTIVAKTNVGGSHKPSQRNSVNGYNGAGPGDGDGYPVIENGAHLTVDLDNATNLGGVSYGRTPCAIKLIRSTDQIITNATMTTITWSSALEDPLRLWNAGTPTYVTVPSGMYHCRVSAQLSWAIGSVGEVYVEVYQSGPSGNGNVSYERKLATTTSETTLVTLPFNVQSGDQISVRVYQNSGGSKNITANTVKASIEFF